MTKFEKGKALNPNEVVGYQDGGIVSMELLHNEQGSITLFAFSKGQQLSPHSAPLDAFIQVTDGEMIMVLDGEEHLVKSGEVFMIPATHVHAVRADQDFKMIITMVKS
ncbi:cupin domain-containing protein [Prevotella sp. oral taxon 376]|uniref:cupin domain-containing protein n=1 Tax=Prevotella sp. oral taxon 376 TaxID=712466 RepID=UPI000D1F7BCD|nr:cupin domain-containing protein [Prevotella sp. oral taxon 376]PTL34176.1 cupin domain-containing protein [Prevotella sp. oral taxon 376]